MKFVMKLVIFVEKFERFDVVSFANSSKEFQAGTQAIFCSTLVFVNFGPYLSTLDDSS